MIFAFIAIFNVFRFPNAFFTWTTLVWVPTGNHGLYATIALASTAVGLAVMAAFAVPCFTGSVTTAGCELVVHTVVGTIAASLFSQLNVNVANTVAAIRCETSNESIIRPWHTEGLTGAPAIIWRRSTVFTQIARTATVTDLGTADATIGLTLPFH